VNIDSEEEREHAMLFTAKYLHPFLRAFERGFEGLDLKILTRSSYPDETGRSVITFVVASEGFKASVILRGAFEDLLAVDGKKKGGPPPPDLDALRKAGGRGGNRRGCDGSGLSVGPAGASRDARAEGARLVRPG